MLENTMKLKDVLEGLKDPKDNPCWTGYKPVGTKKKGGKTVPNCVPKESVEEANVAKITDYKPGQTATIDQGGGTKTMIDLKQNPTALAKDPTTGKLKLSLAPQGPGQAAPQQEPNDGIKPGADVEIGTVEDMADSKSAITGDEEHDEISKLLVRKLRRLAGVDRMS